MTRLFSPARRAAFIARQHDRQPLDLASPGEVTELAGIAFQSFAEKKDQRVQCLFLRRSGDALARREIGEEIADIVTSGGFNCRW